MCETPTRFGARLSGLPVLVASLQGLVVASGAHVVQSVTAPSAAQRPLDGAGGDLSPAEQAEVDDQAEATINRVCVTCHQVDVVARARRSATEWQTLVERMVTIGARATPDEFGAIRRYMTRYYGLVRVNSATAEEFAAVLGYSPRDASAIVARRVQSGPFADLDALAAVPGLDRTRLDAQRDALQFD